MREPDNIRQIAEAGTDWAGFIFYEQSPRYIGSNTEALCSPVIVNGRKIKKVGVFVDATPQEMMAAVDEFHLDYLQLHGNETPEVCYALQKRGLAVIKAFPIATPDDLNAVIAYQGYVNYFLFDTKCKGYGGSGKQFDWQILHAYEGETPFLLSGGLTPDSLVAVKAFNHPCLAGVDLNSGFETAPGMKDACLVAEFIKKLKSQ